MTPIVIYLIGVLFVGVVTAWSVSRHGVTDRDDVALWAACCSIFWPVVLVAIGMMWFFYIVARLVMPRGESK